MPQINLATAEIIQRRLTRAREHLQRLGVLSTGMPIYPIAQASYELCRGLKIPAVKHEMGVPVSLYLDDALTNLTTAIDFDLTLLAIERDQEEVVVAAQAIMQACHQIPLPAAPPSHHP